MGRLLHALHRRLRPSGAPPARRVELLSTLATLLFADSSPESWPPTVLDRLVALLEPDIAAYYVPTNSGSLDAAATHPEELWNEPAFRSKFLSRPLDSYAIGRAVQQKAVILVQDPQAEARDGIYFPFNSRVSAEFILPLFAVDQCVAVIVLSRYHRPFSPTDTAFIETLAPLLSTAYEHAKENRHRQILHAFLASLRNLPSDDSDALIETSLATLLALFEGTFATLWLFNEVDSTFAMRAFAPDSIDSKPVTFDLFEKTVCSSHECLSALTHEEATPKLYTDLSNNPRNANQEFAREFGLSYFHSLPLQVHQSYGVVNVHGRGLPTSPSNELIQTASVVCGYLATLFRAAAYEARERVFFAYDELFFDLLNEGPTQQRWDLIASRIAHQMECEACSIFFLAHQDELVLKGSTGIEGDPPYDTVRYGKGQGLTGSTFAEGKPIVYYRGVESAPAKSHLSKHREKLRRPEKSRSILLMPILDSKQAPIGVIRCNNKEEKPQLQSGRFTKEDLGLLEGIGRVIGDIYLKTTWLGRQKRDFDSTLRSLHHELLAPVHGILTQADWLTRSLVPHLPDTLEATPLAGVRVGDIEQSARQVELTVQNMGMVTQERIYLRLRRLSLRDVLQTCRSWVANEAKRKKFRIDFSEVPRMELMADRSFLARLFQNLFVNAIKYSDSQEVQSYLKVSATKQRRQIRVLVEDNGIGLAEEEADQIFDPGFRGKEARLTAPSGAGLGLTFCRMIIEAHQGTITVDQLRKPTRFALRLPRGI